MRTTNKTTSNYKRISKGIYKTVNGTYRIRKTVNGTKFTTMASSIKEAKEIYNRWNSYSFSTSITN